METSEFAGWSWEKIAQHLIMLDAEHAELKKQTTQAWNRVLDFKRKVIPEMMEDQGIDGVFVTIDGVKRRLTVGDEVGVKTIKLGDGKTPDPVAKATLYHWLKEQGAEDLITETVHSSTLAGYIREQIAAGNPTPDGCVEVSYYQQAKLVKT